MTVDADIPVRQTADCGTFMLDVVGAFPPDRVRLACAPARRTSNAEVDGIIDRTWVSELDCAKQAGRRLYNGRLARLESAVVREAFLDLTVGEVSFKEFLGTNLTHAYLRYLHGPEVLADALGVSAALRTRDGFLLLGRRSQQVYYHAGRIHPIGGVVEIGPDERAIHPAAAMAAELVEEAGVAEAQLAGLAVIGLVRDKHIVQPELIFDVQADADASDIRLQDASDAHEHSELVPIRDHPVSVVAFMQQHFNELTPVCLATLLLHGLRHWGSGWFATTRGHLRSVV